MELDSGGPTLSSLTCDNSQGDLDSAISGMFFLKIYDTAGLLCCHRYVCCGLPVCR